MFDVGGGDLLIMPVPSTDQSAHTVVGFAVPDLAKVMATLEQRGVQWLRVPSLGHDESRVVVSPRGARVVWLRAPDCNILSIVRYA